MGVRDLWTILEPVKQRTSLEDLHGQVIAIDLSIWIVEAKTVLPPSVVKPHLRNLFFRVSHLLQLGVVPVIVVEGVAPDLKQGVMKKRCQSNWNHRTKKTHVVSNVLVPKITRKRFQAVHRECCELLQFLGVPYVQAAGEAEAMCAFLNKHQVVDGCITNDGDVFLYGARTVYRNFTINSKDQHVDVYKMEDIERRLCLSRDSLIGLAVLSGCDYLPKGVKGVGRDTLVKFIAGLNGESILKRFDVWINIGLNGLGKGKISSFSGNSSETMICKKALSSFGFPHKEVIDEFLLDKDKIPKLLLVWKRPKLFQIMNYAREKLDWTEEYTIKKMIRLLTFFDMNSMISSGSSTNGSLCPARIVKTRTRHGLLCYEIEWHKVDGDLVTTSDWYTTIEEQELFKKAFPELVTEWQRGKKVTTKQKRRPKETKTKTSCPSFDDDLISELADRLERTPLLGKINKNQRMLREDDRTPPPVKSTRYEMRQNDKDSDGDLPRYFDNCLKSMRRKSRSLVSLLEEKKQSKNVPEFLLSSESSNDDLIFEKKKEIDERSPIFIDSDDEHPMMMNRQELHPMNTEDVDKKKLATSVDDVISEDDNDSSVEIYLPLSERLELQNWKKSDNDFSLDDVSSKNFKSKDSLNIALDKVTSGELISKDRSRSRLNNCKLQESSCSCREFSSSESIRDDNSARNEEKQSIDVNRNVESSDIESSNSSKRSSELVHINKNTDCKKEENVKMLDDDDDELLDMRSALAPVDSDAGYPSSTSLHIKDFCSTPQTQPQLFQLDSLSNIHPWNASQIGNFNIETSLLNVNTSCHRHERENESETDLFETSSFRVVDISVSHSIHSNFGSSSVNMESVLYNSVGMENCDNNTSPVVSTPPIATISLAERLRMRMNY